MKPSILRMEALEQSLPLEGKVSAKLTDEVFSSPKGKSKYKGHNMNENYNSNLKLFSQKLRKTMTKEEKHLWFDCLKQLPLTVKRQQIIGDYIVDFYCAKKSIVIELDGSQHYEKEGKEKDVERDLFLKSKGIKVLRYSNYDINKNFIAVCEDIRKNLGLINE